MAGLTLKNSERDLAELTELMYNTEKSTYSPYTARDLGGRFKNAYELLNLRALKISMLYKNRTFQCMGKIFCVEFQRGKIFCVEFQRVPLKFHTK